MDLLINCALVWFNFHPNTQKPLSPALLHLVSNDADTANHTRSRFRPTFDTCAMLATPFRLLKVIVNCDKHVLFAENGTKSMHPLGKPSFEKKKYGKLHIKLGFNTRPLFEAIK